MEFLRDPIWTFLGVVAAVLIGFGGIWATLWLRNRKALSFEVVSDVPIVTVRHDSKNAVTEAIEIRYNHNPVKDVRLVVVRIWNSGNVAIAPDDYVRLDDNNVRSIEVTFNGQMLASDVIETEPPMSRNELLMGGGVGPNFSMMKFRPILLNPRDSVTIQALLTGYNGEIGVNARIVGVSAIKEVKRGQLPRSTAVFAGVTFILGLLMLALSLSLAGGTGAIVSLLSGVFFGIASAIAVAYLRGLRANRTATEK